VNPLVLGYAPENRGISKVFHACVAVARGDQHVDTPNVALLHLAVCGYHTIVVDDLVDPVWDHSLWRAV
jgi:hypothetical protein